MRILSLFIISVLILGMHTANIEADDESHTIQTYEFVFKNLKINEEPEQISLSLDGANAYYYIPGKPIIPYYRKVIELPFGIRILDITYSIDSPLSTTIIKPVDLAPNPIIRNSCYAEQQEKQTVPVHLDSKVYPGNWFNYFLGAGLNEKQKQVSKLILHIYPLQIDLLNNIVKYVENISITIQVEHLPLSSKPANNIYDMVIIAPARFVPFLHRLAIHKSNYGIQTLVKPVHEIYHQFPGQDKPEQIKYYIKHAIETYGIQYVLLVGGLKSFFYANPRDDINQGSGDWFIPVRYTNIKENDSVYDPGFISDLYFADIYDASGNFSNWDSNDDGVFGKWSNEPNPRGYQQLADYSVNQSKPPDTDIIDFYPDVYLGRLPCRNILEVQRMVSKIIRYETTALDSYWFDRIVLVGGDPYDDKETNILEGEEICNKACEYLPEYDHIKLYASHQFDNPRKTPLSRNIIYEINQGCGHLLFDGHASPVWWNTFWPYQFDSLIKMGGLNIYQFPLLLNKDKLPICVIGGCHSCQFNISLFNSIVDRNNSMKMWTFGLPAARCFGWALIGKSFGGAIATLGCTGLGYEADGEHGDIDGDGEEEPDCVEVLGGYLETEFYSVLSENMFNLGDAWGLAINHYLDTHPGMLNQSYAKTIEQWVLLGDPSLRIGGYH